MTVDEHVDQAHSFISDSLALQQQGSGMLAAEAVWGAAVQAIAAVSHTLGTDVRRHPRQSNAIEQLFERHNLAAAFEIDFTNARNRLHNHFYTGQLSDEEFEGAIEDGRSLVHWLLSLAGPPYVP